jgi:hypothetical protein
MSTPVAPINELFAESTSEVAVKLATVISVDDIMELICRAEGNVLVADYRYFKHAASPSSYAKIVEQSVKSIDRILETYPHFIAHMCIKSLTVSDIDKHMEFIKVFCSTLKLRYQDKMSKCYVYKAPFIFSQIYSIVSCFIDKDTRPKVELVKAD